MLLWLTYNVLHDVLPFQVLHAEMTLLYNMHVETDTHPCALDVMFEQGSKLRSLTQRALTARISSWLTMGPKLKLPSQL